MWGVIPTSTQESELKTNAVKLSPDEQYQIRKSIVRLSKKGKTNGEIAEILDVSEKGFGIAQGCSGAPKSVLIDRKRACNTDIG